PQGSYTVTEGSNPEWIQTAPASGSYTINLNSCQIVDSINFANRMRACTPPPSGMVAWWTLKETGGTAFQDDAGIHNNGTSSGGPTLATGKVSNARSFDGSDDYIEVPDHAELNFGTGDFSFDAWIKTTDSNSVKVFLDKRVSSPAYRGYEIFLFNGILHIQLSDGTSDNYGSGTFVADNQWHHIAITVDRDTANGIAFYVDGALVANANPTNHSGTLTNSSPLRLGSDIAGGGTPFNGTLDEIELFSRILTPTEVRSLWEADTAGKCMTVDSCLNFGTINPCLCSCKTVTTTGAVTPTSCASGNESYGQLIINAAPNSSLLLACSIPTQLINGSNTIPLSNMTASYSTTGVSGTFTSFDPFAGTTVTTGSTGDVIVRFGGRICPLRNLPGGEYTGYLLLTWKYTGTLTPTTNDLGLCITADIIDENCCVTAPPNLSNWWSLDETSGTTSADRKGFPNTGTHVNSPTPVAGKVEGALDFNGVDQYIEVPDHNDLDVGVGDFTIDAWVKTTSTAAFSIILDKRIASPTQGYSFFLIDGVWFLQLADASGGSDVCGPTANCMNYSSTIFVSDGAWHHLAVTVDRNNPSGIIFYFDGIASGVTADPTGQANSLSNSAPLRIGTRSFDLNNPFRGQLDEIEIFKRALTPSEILSLYFADSLGKCKRDIVDDSYDVVINPKWNIVSVPVVAPDFTKTTLFPDALSVAFTFDGAYAPAPTLDNAHGYWIKFGDTATTNLTGTPIFANSYPLNAGWNMVASLGAPVDVSSPSQVALMTMPEGIISSSFFGYNNGYSVASSLEPGKGYWVKTDEDGILSLEASVDLGKQAAQPEQLALSQLKKLTFKDAVQNGQTLYFGNNPGENFKQSLYDLPPMPPQGVFDIRFASQRMAEIYPDNENRVQEYVINLTSVTYPLDITFDVPETQREKITLVAMFDGKVIKKYTLRNNEKITIENQSVNRIVLKTTTQTIIPTQYTLYQCYPNPFNPSTMIDFDIPANSYVTLKVYDVIGREVVTILNHEQYDAGRYQKVFNANNLASGLYFYRITAVGQDGILSYTDIKKMVLLK
ncbi:MAG: T9SS type A sorting domain-containing protein, partial [Bacteroidetes bacterium]